MTFMSFVEGKPLKHISVTVKVQRYQNPVQNQWESLYLKGTRVKTIHEVVDPFYNDPLPIGSVLTVEEVITGNAGVWLQCKKVKGSFESEWNIRPRDVEIETLVMKAKGRYKILLQNKDLK